jgi:glycosyltransferase involved in cell wall biosynthesis
MFLSVLLLGTFFYLFFFAVQLKLQSINRIFYDDIKFVPTDFHYPSISIVVTGRNEEKDIDDAIRSMAKTNYPNLTIIAVNDRSTDRTGAILNQIACDHKNVRPVHIDTLPQNWLGKTHALHQGLSMVDSEWILFTDADIKFANEVLQKAIFICKSTRIDHLTTYPEILYGSVLEKGFVSAFGLLFALDRPTWRVENLKSKTHIGIGAFNLISKKAMTDICGFEHLKMSVDDDIKLGELLKTYGYRTKIAFGVNHISLRWQADLKAYIKGFEKNAFASMDFNLAMGAFALFGIFITTILPTLTLLFFPLIDKIIAAGILAVLAFILHEAKRNTKIEEVYVFLLPMSGILLAISITNSIYATLKSGGIAWRDTFYPISQLKKHISERRAHIELVRKTRAQNL